MDLNFDIRYNCHEIYDSLYRNNQKSPRRWTSRQDNALVQTYNVIEHWIHDGNIYLQDLHDNDNLMYNILVQWTTMNFKDIQDILRGGLRTFRKEDPFFTLIKNALVGKLKDMGYTYFFKQQRKALYDAFFRGWNIRKSFDANKMDETVITDMSNILKRWNDVIYNAPRYKNKVIMYRGFKQGIAKKLKNMKIGERHTEYGFTSLSLSYNTAKRFFTKPLEWLGYGYVAGFEITPHTPICWIAPLNKVDGLYEGLLCCGAVFEKIGRHYFRIVGYDRTRNTVEWLMQDNPNNAGFGKKKERLLRKPDRSSSFKFAPLSKHQGQHIDTIQRNRFIGNERLLRQPERSRSFQLSGVSKHKKQRNDKVQRKRLVDAILKQLQYTDTL